MDIEKIYKDSNALLDGHFKLSSGNHSKNYLQSAKVLEDPKTARLLAEALAEQIAESGIEIDAVCSPALGGLIAGFALAPGTEYDIKVTSVTGSVENINDFVEDSFTSKTPSGAPTSFVLAESPAGTLAGSWSAPSSGVPPTGYNIYGKAPSAGVADYVLLTPTPSTFTVFSASEFGGFPLATGVEYFIKVTSVNADGENVTSFVEDSVTIVGEV